MSESSPSVIERMRAVMAEVTSIEKGDKYEGGSTRFNFRGVDRTVKALSASIRKHGLIILPKTTSVSWQAVTTANGKPAGRSEVLVTYWIYGPNGDCLEFQVPGEAMDSGDKSVSKAMSVAWRTGLLQAFFLPTGDPDPDMQQYEMGVQGVQFKGARAAGERLVKNEQAEADWNAALEAATGDFEALGKLHNEAQRLHAPVDVLSRIRAAGNAAMPKDRNEPH